MTPADTLERITPPLPDYANRAIARINHFIKDEDDPWIEKGSAGQARDWFLDATNHHPHDPYAALAELEATIAAEIERRPRWFTRGHLRGVVAIVREEVGL